MPVRVVPKEEVEDYLAGEFSGMRALVVEDQKTNQRAIKGILERLGISVYIADNGEIGYNIFKVIPEC